MHAIAFQIQRVSEGNWRSHNRVHLVMTPLDDRKTMKHRQEEIADVNIVLLLQYEHETARCRVRGRLLEGTLSKVCLCPLNGH